MSRNGLQVGSMLILNQITMIKIMEKNIKSHVVDQFKKENTAL